MAETYTGAQVYERIVQSITFMEQRVQSLERRLRDNGTSTAGVEQKITEGRKDLSIAYLKGSDLENADARKSVYDCTGLDLTYVVDEYRKKEDVTREQISAIESDRLYLMRDSMNTTKEGGFVDERLNAITAIEEHPGYKGADDLEGLRTTGFLEGTHRKGYLGFRGRRLEQLATTVARELGYATFQEMEHGQGTTFERLEDKAGRKEQRASIPLLLLNPEMSVLEVKAKVEGLLQTHASSHREIETLKESRHMYAIEELAKHFGVIRLENLRDGSNGEVTSYLGILRDLLSQKDNYLKEKGSIVKEQTEYTKQIADLNATLAKFPGLKDSKETIDASRVDALLSGDDLQSLSISDLDALIKRDFPKAVAYTDFTHTHRPASQVSRTEWQDTVQRAGGVGKWTEWRKV